MFVLARSTFALQQLLETPFIALALPNFQAKIIVVQLKRIIGQIVKFDEILVVFKAAVNAVFFSQSSYTMIGIVEAVRHPPNSIIRRWALGHAALSIAFPVI